MFGDQEKDSVTSQYINTGHLRQLKQAIKLPTKLMTTLTYLL